VGPALHREDGPATIAALEAMKSRSWVVHQYHDAVQPNDAVSNHLLLIQKSLKAVGIGGEIFARQIRPTTWRGAKSFDEKRSWNCDLLILHHSQGSPWLNRVLRIEVPKALIYHNITPAEHFRHDPYIADLSRRGRGQLLHLQKNVVRAFGVSKYNAAELRHLGFTKPGIFPLLDLSGQSASHRKSHEAKKFLFVGKITPHKNQALLVKTIFYLKQILPEPPKLVLVGGADPLYLRYVKHLVRLLGLSEEVSIVGKTPTEVLEEYYRSADAYLSASLHEGFGVPLVQAMQYGLPVFALPSAGVPETLGGAGVLLSSRRPHRMAEEIAKILPNDKKRARILEAQSERFKALRQFQSAKQIQTMIQETLHALHP